MGSIAYGQIGANQLANSAVGANAIAPAVIDLYHQYHKEWIHVEGNAIGIATVTTAGSGAVTWGNLDANALMGQYALLDTGSTTHSVAAISDGSFNGGNLGTDPFSYLACIKIVQLVASTRLIFGILDSPIVAATGAIPNNGAGFYYDGTNFKIYARNGTTTTSTNITAPSTGHYHVFSLYATTTTVQFLIDGVSVGSISATLPTGVVLGWYAVINNQGAVDNQLQVAWLQADSTLQ